LLTTPYAIPIALLNPYLAGGLFVDYLVRGRYHAIPKHPEILGPDNLSALTAPAAPKEYGAIAGIAAEMSSSAGSSACLRVPSAAPSGAAATLRAGRAGPGSRGIGAANE
jgi:hypothetical protein